jgi:hypothetical protein
MLEVECGAPSGVGAPAVTLHDYSTGSTHEDCEGAFANGALDTSASEHESRGSASAKKKPCAGCMR